MVLLADGSFRMPTQTRNASPRNDDKIVGPGKRLMRDVRRNLKRYGIVPVEPIWSQAWEWARKIGDSYITSRGTRWPQPREIATQYVFLLLTTLKADDELKLPFRAERMPESVVRTLALARETSGMMPQLGAEPMLQLTTDN